MTFEHFEKSPPPSEERTPEESKARIPEKNSELPIAEILKEKADKIDKEIKEISPEAKKRLFDSARRISENIPEVIITGGTALRIYLENLNKKVPVEFGEDIDCITDKESYEKIREALPPRGEKEAVLPHFDKPFSTVRKEKLHLTYKRKEGEESPGDRKAYLKDPENHTALEDKESSYHIDIFPKQDITLDVKKVELKGQKMNLLSPEELFLRNMSSVKKGIESKQLQRRHANYFYLTGGLIDEKRMDKLWKVIKTKEAGKNLEDWRKIWLEFNENIRRAENEGEIKEEVTH